MESPQSRTHKIHNHRVTLKGWCVICAKISSKNTKGQVKMTFCPKVISSSTKAWATETTESLPDFASELWTIKCESQSGEKQPLVVN